MESSAHLGGSQVVVASNLQTYTMDILYECTRWVVGPELRNWTEIDQIQAKIKKKKLYLFLFLSLWSTEYVLLTKWIRIPSK